MPLSPDERQQLIEWLNSKAGELRCQICGRNDWTLGNELTALVAMEGSNLNLGRQVPVVALVCSNCYHVLLFAGVPLGLLGKAGLDQSQHA
jgi:hypothetical protein